MQQDYFGFPVSNKRHHSGPTLALLSFAIKSRPVKTWGPVDGLGHAMFGWAMEEEAKLEFTITVNWRREDGSIATTQLGTLDRSACNSRTPSQFSAGYKRLWSANNCSGTAKLCGRVPAVIVGAT
jgi:hypothetical protein